MSNDTCGVELVYGEGICEFPAKHPDGKCGIHSEHTDSRANGRTIQEPLIQDFLDHERRYRPANTFDSRITGLRAFDEWLESEEMDVLEVRRKSIKDFASWLNSERGRGASDGTASKYLEQVSKFYQHLREREEETFGRNGAVQTPVIDARESGLSDIIKDPNTPERAKAMKDDEGYRAMSPDEFEELMANLPAPATRNQLIFQLMWDCGLRPIEVTEIRIRDIDRENREINIRSNKTHLNRTVFYGDKVSTMIGIWLDGGERDRWNYAEASPYLLISEQAEQITVTLIQDIFRKAAVSSGLHDEPLYVDARGNPHYELDPYSLRHGYAERMVQMLDLETLRMVMGHKSLETTKRYLNPDKETRRKNVQRALDD